MDVLELDDELLEELLLGAVSVDVLEDEPLEELESDVNV